jgi:phenylacetate-CoA ligase
MMANETILRQAAITELQLVESFNRDALADWQLQQLNVLLEHAGMHSSFYRKQKAVGRLPDRLHCYEELAQLPFTTKEDLRNEYPLGFLAVPQAELSRYGESTGTSGRPTSSFITYEDWIRGNVWVEESFRHYFSSDDTAFIAIPYELTFASYDIDRALEQLGVTIVAAGTLNQICPFPRLVQMMRDLHPTCLVCTPTRALRLFDMLVDQGYNPLDVGLRKLLYVGETCSSAKLRKIAECWNIELITAYGSTETNSLALQCPLGRSHLSEGRYCFEIVDPETGVLQPAGVPGEIILTSLRSRAMPLIRYRTGDLGVVGEEPCACGSPRRTLQHLGRVMESLEVEGTNIGKLALEEVILSAEGTGVYYAAGERDGRLEICVEALLGAGTSVCAEVQHAVYEAFGIRAAVKPVPRRVLTAAMDRMLKPGSLSLDDVEITEYAAV